jgi:hypothetical protein
LQVIAGTTNTDSYGKPAPHRRNRSHLSAHYGYGSATDHLEAVHKRHTQPPTRPTYSSTYSSILDTDPRRTTLPPCLDPLSLRPPKRGSGCPAGAQSNQHGEEESRRHHKGTRAAMDCLCAYSIRRAYNHPAQPRTTIEPSRQPSADPYSTLHPIAGCATPRTAATGFSSQRRRRQREGRAEQRDRAR